MSASSASALIGIPGSVRPKCGKRGLIRVGERLVELLTRSRLGAGFIHGRGRKRRSTIASNAYKAKTLRFDVPSRPEMIWLIRDRATEFASTMPFTSEQIDDVRLAVGEAAANALRHGANAKWRRIGVELRKKGNTLRVAVWDRGRGFDPRAVCRTQECLVEGGRGVFLMRAFMDDVRFRFTRPGTRVDMTKTASAR